MSDTGYTVNVSESVPDFEMPAPGSPGYDEFRKTGKLPSAEDSAPPEKETEQAPTKQESTETEPSSEASATSTTEKEPAVTRAEPATAPQQKKKTGEQRQKQINEDIREALRVLAEVREETAKLRKPESQTAAETKLDSAKAPAKPVRPKMEDVDAEGKPRYKTYGEYQAAFDKYLDDRDAYIEKEALQKAMEQAASAFKQREAEQQERSVSEAYQAKLTKAYEKHSDYESVFQAVTSLKDNYGNDLIFIPKGAPVDQFFVKSAAGPEVLYFIGTHVDETKHIFARTPDGKNFLLDPVEQIRELTKIEFALDADAVKTPKPASSARSITQAPPPPHQVTGTGPKPDPVEAAVKDGDFAAFAEAENAKQLARRKLARGR